MQNVESGILMVHGSSVMDTDRPAQVLYESMFDGVSLITPSRAVIHSLQAGLPITCLVKVRNQSALLTSWKCMCPHQRENISQCQTLSELFCQHDEKNEQDRQGEVRCHNGNTLLCVKERRKDQRKEKERKGKGKVYLLLCLTAICELFHLDSAR